MAKRKLSELQRASLRKELSSSIKAGAKTADVLRAVAKKYGISTITARWYLNSLSGTKTKKGVRRGRPPGSRNGHANLAKVVQEQAERMKEAARLVPRWQKLVDREKELRSRSLKLGRRLEAAGRKASKLRTRIAELIG